MTLQRRGWTSTCCGGGCAADEPRPSHRGEIQTIVAARRAGRHADGVHRRRPPEHRRDPRAHGPQPRARADLRVGHDRRQAVPHPTLDRRRRAGRDRRRGRVGPRDVQLLDRRRAAIDVAFLGAAQIDRFANLNSTVIGDYDHPRTRLPEPAARPRSPSSCGEVIVDRGARARTLVERLDFVTTVGHGDGPGARERLGLRGRGPTAVITDLGVLEPDPGTLRARADASSTRASSVDRCARGDRLGARGRRGPADDRAAERRASSRRCGSCSRGEHAYVSRRCARRSAATAAGSRPCAPTTWARSGARAARPVPDPRSGRDRRGPVRRRQQRRRGQPQRGADGVRCCRPADQRSRLDGQPLCGSAWTRRCRPPRRSQTGEARRRAGRRGRVDEPRAVGPAQARACVPGSGARSSTRARWGGGWSTRTCLRSGRSRSARAPRSWPVSTACPREDQDAFALRSHQNAQAA